MQPSREKERMAEYARAYRERKGDEINAKRRAKYAADPERYREQNRQYRARNPEAVRNSNLRKTYGITLQEYNRLLEKQGGACAICEGSSNGRGYYHVDHCHRTQQVRGLLCHRCNTGLGLLGDSEEGLRKALAYLTGAKKLA